MDANNRQVAIPDGGNDQFAVNHRNANRGYADLSQYSKGEMESNVLNEGLYQP